MDSLTRSIVAEIEACKKRLSFLETLEPYVFGARCFRSTTQNFPSGASTALSWDTEVYDTDGLWVIGSPDRFTAARAGYYIAGGGYNTSDAFGATEQAQISVWKVSGGTTYQLASHWGDFASGHAVGLVIATGMFYLAAGDYVQIIGYQNSGGALTFNVATAEVNRRNHGWIMRVVGG